MEICSFHSAIAESARSTICWRRTCLSRTGECDVSSIRPNVTFMGSNFSDGGLSEQWRASEPIAVVYGIGTGSRPSRTCAIARPTASPVAALST